MPETKKSAKNSAGFELASICVAVPAAVLATFPLHSWLTWLQTEGRGRSPFAFRASAYQRFSTVRFPFVHAMFLKSGPYLLSSLPSKIAFFYPLLLVKNQYPDNFFAAALGCLTATVLQSMITYVPRMKQVYANYKEPCSYRTYLNRAIFQRCYFSWLAFFLVANASIFALSHGIGKYMDQETVRGKFLSTLLAILIAQSLIVPAETLATQMMDPRAKILSRPTCAMFGIRAALKLSEFSTAFFISDQVKSAAPILTAD